MIMGSSSAIMPGELYAPYSSCGRNERDGYKGNRRAILFPVI